MINDNDGWFSWTGGRRPPVSAKTKVWFRTASNTRRNAERHPPIEAGKLRWTNEDSPGDIVEYKVAG